MKLFASIDIEHVRLCSLHVLSLHFVLLSNFHVFNDIFHATMIVLTRLQTLTSSKEMDFLLLLAKVIK